MALPPSVLDKMSPEARARLQGAAKPTPPATPPAARPAPTGAPAPLDFDSQAALDAGQRGPAKLPWDIEIVLKGDLLGVKHVQGRACPRYEFIFKVLESNRADVSVGSTRCLMVHYEPNPRNDNEQYALQAKLGEIRGIVAACLGQDPRNPEFLANQALAEMLTLSADGVELHMLFGLEQVGRINKIGKQTYDKRFTVAA